MDRDDVDSALFTQALIRSVFPSPRRKWSPLRLLDRLTLWWRRITKRHRYIVGVDRARPGSGDVDCWIKARYDTETGKIIILEHEISTPSSSTDPLPLSPSYYANLRCDSH